LVSPGYVGTEDGTVEYWPNSGSAAAFAFTHDATGDIFLDGASFAKPCVVDYDGGEGGAFSHSQSFAHAYCRSDHESNSVLSSKYFHCVFFFALVRPGILSNCRAVFFFRRRLRSVCGRRRRHGAAAVGGRRR
jgi:hypothetical protein